MKKSTTLGSLKEGDRFKFGGIIFKVRFIDDTDEMVGCYIGDTEATVHITKCAWVDPPVEQTYPPFALFKWLNQLF